MKTYKLYRSDYTNERYSVVQNYLIMASEIGYVTGFIAFTNFCEITSNDTVYNDLQHLINN